MPKSFMFFSFGNLSHAQKPLSTKSREKQKKIRARIPVSKSFFDQNAFLTGKNFCDFHLKSAQKTKKKAVFKKDIR